MGRKKQYKYYNPTRGGDIMYAKEYPSIQKQADIRFVVLEIMDEKDGRYKVWTGNEKTAIFSKFFDFSQEGFKEAVEEYSRRATPEMRTIIDNCSLEKERLNGSCPPPKPNKEDLRLLKKNERNKLRLLNLLGEMKEDGQIGIEELTTMFNKL